MKRLLPNRVVGRPFAAAVAVLVALGATVGRAADVDSVAAIYQAKCAGCHGADGQGGTDEYADPLFGELSVDELADLVDRTMPEDAPEMCVGEEARRVAEYIHREFYSIEARQRKGLAPAPTVERARLTVPQFRNAVADLIGQVTPVPRSDTRRRQGRGRRRRDGGDRPAENRRVEPERPDVIVPEPGLRAEYYQSKGMNKADQLAVQRIDHRVDFDFGEASPAEGIAPEQFAIIWQGAVVAKNTGEYEFRIRTQNGARLYINSDSPEDRRKLRDDSDIAGQFALIDEWVSSGEMREGSARVFLLGGREYPLRLEFFKYLEKTASIRFEWKPPHGTWSVLDSHHLTTARAPRTFVVESPFPADDRSLGYERGSSVSQEWHAATTEAAVAAADEVVNRLSLLAGLDEDDAQRRRDSDQETEADRDQEKLRREERIKQFLVRLAGIAYRRPLTGDEEAFFREMPFVGAEDPEAAVRRAVIFMLQSPHFLYADLTPAGQTPDRDAIASRLSLTLWDSIPDEPLRQAAASGQLATHQQIEAQAHRMLDDPRTKAKMRDFFHHWLEVDDRDVVKDREMFPEFDEAVVADLRYSLDAFLEEVLWSDSSDYRQLLLANYLVLNDRLSEIYQPQTSDVCSPAESDAAESDVATTDKGESATPEGDAAGEAEGAETAEADAAANDDERTGTAETVLAASAPATDFRRVGFAPDRRVGVLTHPYLLSAFAYHNNTSPIHRGVFLTRNIVGRPLKPPPAAVAFKDDEFAPDLTMREKITQLTRGTACMSCHSVINPLGFALENYDAVGRWRTSDKDKPVDSRSHYTTAGGETLELRSARDIAVFAAESKAAHRAFVTQVFKHLVKQNPVAYGSDTVERLRQEFADDKFNMQNLLVRIAVRTSMHGHADRDTLSLEVQSTQNPPPLPPPK